MEAVQRPRGEQSIVKGRTDYLANKEGVKAVIDHPIEEAMEAIGGTGDTLTGIVAALSATGMDIHEAALTASRVNRLAGAYAHPTPATQVREIIQYIPKALGEILSKECQGSEAYPTGNDCPGCRESLQGQRSYFQTL